MVRILCVHGIGHGDTDASQKDAWQTAISSSIKFWDPAADVQVQFVQYDDLFEQVSLGAVEIAKALAELLAGGASVGLGNVGDLIGGLFRPRGLTDFNEEARWTAGMVVQWVENDQLKADTRQRVLDGVASFNPDVVCAHSLGSLISYDAFARADGADAIQDKVFVTLGSQLGNPFVRGTAFGGRIVDLDGAKEWYHLYNPNDHVFTAPLTIAADNFLQVDATFDNQDLLNHAAARYLANGNVLNQVWRPVTGAPEARALKQSVKAFAKLTDPPKRRALLVGINAYPNQQDQLAGCVNDVFLMSAVLQEMGFDAEDIRVVLDERATAATLRERLHWLLDGAGSGDQRFFFYSGHGAQLPAYGAQGKVDRVDSSLVPYDFRWTRETAITDDQFVDLYSQLPYDAHFMTVFDCCYSGGMVRAGGAKVRGIDPPDDIRHRMLKWDAVHEMWVPRTLPPQNAEIADSSKRMAYLGESGATRRLGRAIALRTASVKKCKRLRKEFGHKGPYQPVVYEACREDQFSYEYRHGVTSYGAFTYSLARIFRHQHTLNRAISFALLLEQAQQTLKELDYDQTPVLIGPKEVVKQPIPWQAVRKERGKKKG
jgi:hypothetical protein